MFARPFGFNAAAVGPYRGQGPLPNKKRPGTQETPDRADERGKHYGRLPVARANPQTRANGLTTVSPTRISVDGHVVGVSRLYSTPFSSVSDGGPIVTDHDVTVSIPYIYMCIALNNDAADRGASSSSDRHYRLYIRIRVHPQRLKHGR